MLLLLLLLLLFYVPYGVVDPKVGLTWSKLNELAKYSSVNWLGCLTGVIFCCRKINCRFRVGKTVFQVVK